MSDIDEVSFNGSRSGHGGADQVGSSAFALTAFEVSIAGAGASLAGLEFVWVHRQTHAASGFTPIETRFHEDFIETFFFSLQFDLAAAGDDHRANA